MAKLKIVLDADVIFHFSRVDGLGVLFRIFEDIDYVILSPVYEEILTHEVRLKLDNFKTFFSAFELIDIDNLQKGIKFEYIRLRSLFGKGESACMAFCKDSNNIIGSSNLKDIKRYCEDNNICYLT